MYRGDERQNVQDTNKRSITIASCVNKFFTRFLQGKHLTSQRRLEEGGSELVKV